MTKVKCAATGLTGDSGIFYKAADEKYYKNKEIYLNYTQNQKATKKIIRFLNVNFLNQGTKNFVNDGFIIKKIKELGIEPRDLLPMLEDHQKEISTILSDKGDLSIGSKILVIMNYISNMNKLRVSYAGCYCIENINTHITYIGESIDIFSRFLQHVDDLYKNQHHCKALQEAFNINKSIKDFYFKPLYLLPILSKDKKNEKEETLYLEAAFCIKYVSEGKKLYNTVNPYTTLKNGKAHYLEENDINAEAVLRKVYIDKYRILPVKVLKVIRRDLENVIDVSEILIDKNDELETEINVSSTNDNYNTKNIKDTSFATLKNEKKNPSKNNEIKIPSSVPSKYKYIITAIFREAAQMSILPDEYDYNKVREKLVENDIIYMDENHLTVATQKSLDNEWFFLCSETISSTGSIRRKYYISEDGKNEIFKILSKYSKENFLCTVA